MGTSTAIGGTSGAFGGTKGTLARLAVFLLAAAPAVALAEAQAPPSTPRWSVTNLHPDGGTLSIAYGTFGGTHVGMAVVGGNRQGVIWEGTGMMWRSLSPPPSVVASFVAAQDNAGQRQVGFGSINGPQRALLWSGTAESWIDLHPPAAVVAGIAGGEGGATGSGAKGTDNVRQVGFAEIGGRARACMWNGTAASWVDLHPFGALRSYAHGVQGQWQVGRAWMPGGFWRASLWNGSAESWVDLTPLGTATSAAYDIHDGVQVGYADGHAGLWRGTRESWVDLHPAGALVSHANAVYAGRQVGQVSFSEANGGMSDRASLWTGTADSWEDLTLALVGSWRDTEAHGIWSDANRVFVVGSGLNTQIGRTEALLWVRSIYCDADFDRSGGEPTISDVVAFVEAYFAGSYRADYNASGAVSVQDIFDFLAAYFAGCN